MSTGAPIRILIVDDHDIVREGIEILLSLEKDLVVAGMAANGNDALEAFSRLHPDVVLLDLAMPGLDGIEVLGRLRQMDPQAKILILTSNEGDDVIHRALDSGAAGYLLKSTPRAQLADAIRKAASGKLRLGAEVAAHLAERAQYSPLTAREIEVLACVSSGDRNKEIAETLGLSVSTVKGHVNTILTKLGATDRTEAVTIALRRGIIQLDR